MLPVSIVQDQILLTVFSETDSKFTFAHHFSMGMCAYQCLELHVLWENCHVHR